MHWLIEDFGDDNSFGKLAQSGATAGHGVQVMRYEPYESTDLSFFKAALDAKVVFQGSINFAQQIQKERPHWNVFANWEKFYCSAYYPVLSKFLYNGHYEMLPLEVIQSQAESLVARYDGHVFMRPDDCKKSFAGQVMALEDFSGQKWKQIMCYKDNVLDPCNPKDLALIAPPCTPEHEWRVIVSTRTGVVTCSTYRVGKKKELKEQDVPEVRALALQVLEAYQPDPVFVVDIAYHQDKGFKVLELGPFSVAGLYACNTDAIVSEVQQILEG